MARTLPAVLVTAVLAVVEVVVITEEVVSLIERLQKVLAVASEYAFVETDKQTKKDFISHQIPYRLKNCCVFVTGKLFCQFSTRKMFPTGMLDFSILFYSDNYCYNWYVFVNGRKSKNNENSPSPPDKAIQLAYITPIRKM